MIRSDGAPAEGKRNRSDTEQVRLAKAAALLRTAACGQAPGCGFVAVKGHRDNSQGASV